LRREGEPIKPVKDRISHTTVVAYLALFVALGGSAYAVDKIGSKDIAKNAVKSKHIKKRNVKGQDLAPGAVNSKKVADGSLLRVDFAPNQLPQGDKGDKGDKGDPASDFFTTFEFGERSFTGNTSFTFEVPRQTIDNAMISVYYNPTGEAESAWYQASGLGPSNSYQVRYFLHQINPSPSTYTLGVRLRTPDGSAQHPTAVTWRKTRVVVGPTG
jgi:hypothetical protein